ncbi:hypothetical protein GCM10011491_25630 [Brucella endophytica]|uniref:DUF3329 domain-containing protein n=1 Tax=Brucella endophytica TaxID=1963359 RepID=A0A916SH94_9HYPH|nr:DUF3329 domain-containing protein [Brucella endophytica]GGA96129.1 hypothetical protein GCM10011491_25630 [Brucella endophytica]
MNRNSASHPFLDPLWRRVLLIAFCAIWSIVEWTRGDSFWGTLTLGVTLYGAWAYLWKYQPMESGKETGE